MKLTEIKIQNFRSFKDETIPLDDYTCLVGPNGTGKSAVLMALNVFFRNNDSTVTNVLDLTREDFHHENVQEPVKITVTFEDLPSEDDPLVSQEAKELLKLYARQDKLVLFAKAEWDPATERAPVKQKGSRSVMKELKPYFEAKEKGALVPELKAIYSKFRAKFPELPRATTGTAMYNNLQEYENKRPDECSMEDGECECYGFTGGLYRLADLVQWVYVPAVKDASSEEEEGLTEREHRYLSKHAINHRLVTEKGSPIDTVLEVAEREGSDLLLIGSHGTHKIRDYILGSTTVHLLRRSPLPVLIVY